MSKEKDDISMDTMLAKVLMLVVIFFIVFIVGVQIGKWDDRQRKEVNIDTIRGLKIFHSIKR